MRKFTLLLGGCLLMASTVSANPTFTGRQMTAGQAMKEIHPSAKVEKPANAIEFKGRKAPIHKMHKAPVAGSEWNIITEAPAGTTTLYKKSSSGVMVYLGMFLLEYKDEFSAEVTFTDNNEVYIKDILSNVAVDTYVKGTLADGVITVDLGQCVFFDEEYGYGMKLSALSMIEDEEGAYFEADDTKDKVTYTVAEDGTITMEDDFILGYTYTYDNSFAGYCDYTQTYAVFNEKPVTKPESVTAEQWAMVMADNSGHFVNVGIEGNDIYVGGLSESMPDAWVKGTIDGNKVTFENGQYMGPYAHYFIYLMNSVTVMDPDYGETLELTEAPMTFDYDATAKKLTPTTDNTWILNASLTKVYYLYALSSPAIAYQGAAKPAVPSDPYGLEVDPYDPEYGEGTFYFNLPIVDANGTLLDADCYHYNIFVDGEIYTLYNDEYVLLDYDELTDIPYNYTEDYDIGISGSSRTLYFFFDGAETMGVQGVYTVDGVTNKTNIISYVLATGETTNSAGIDSITDAKQVSSTVYYDLTGHKVTNPSAGLYIKKTVYTDGTVKSTKSFMK